MSKVAPSVAKIFVVQTQFLRSMDAYSIYVCKNILYTLHK